LFARSAIAIVVVCSLAGGCVRNSSVADVRGMGGGWQLTLQVKPPPMLEAGKAVRIVDAGTAATCRVIGYVSGVTARHGIRAADMDRAALVATLSRDAAVTDARNLTGKHGGDAVVFDAEETIETGREVGLLVHGRALRCAR
jgi:hypothetical protein